MTEKNDLAFIEHILDSIKAIKEFSRGIRKVELISSRLKQSAIVREIEIIGEAVKNLSEQLKVNIRILNGEKLQELGIK